jgi:hypothetical protein
MSNIPKQDNEQAVSAPSTLDMLGMPDAARRIVRIMLRRPQMTYDEIRAAMEALPEDKRASRAELDEALELLCQLKWLAKEQTDEAVVYKVGIGSKPGSDVTRAGPKREAGQTQIEQLWDAVDSSDSLASTATEKEGPQPKQKKGLLQWLFGKKPE